MALDNIIASKSFPSPRPTRVDNLLNGHLDATHFIFANESALILIMQLSVGDNQTVALVAFNACLQVLLLILRFENTSLINAHQFVVLANPAQEAALSRVVD